MPTTDTDTIDRASAAILELLAERDPGKTICPSEAARVLAGDGDFRPYMEPVREAAGQLVDADRIEVTQKGRRIDVAKARGPIRLGWPEDKAGRQDALPEKEDEH